MLPFNKILFPVDFSESCRLLTPYLKDMMRQFPSAELVALRAVGNPIGIIPVGMAEGAAPLVPSLPEIVNQQTERLNEFVAKNLAGMKVRTMVKEGDPASAINNVVKHEGADLVMMPTHGEGAFRRLLLGSVTTKVLHDVSCAVWTSTNAVLAAPQPHFPYKTIVCALGLTEESSAILHAAAAIAKSSKARLHLVHSVETPPAAYEVDYGPFRKALMEGAEDALRSLRSAENVDATITVGSGAIADVIREECEKHHADLVITGRGHAQDRLSRVWSALYAVVREAPCPVLSI